MLLSSGAGLSSSSVRELLTPRELLLDFVDLPREAAAAILECIELNLDHPS